MLLEKQSIICELCGKTFKPTGIVVHSTLLLHGIQCNNPSTVSDPDIHNINDIWVEYHPNSGKPMNTQRFSEFAWRHVPKAYKPNLCKEWFTLKDYNNLHCTWKAALHRMTPFTKDIISVQPADDPELETFPVYHWSLWDWACDLLKDPHVGPNFVFDAQCLSKFDGTSFVHFIDEPWTANKFWNVQSKIPSDGKTLVFILYTDKAKLSSFRQQKGYPVVACLANLPTWIQNGEGIGGGHMAGWLPIVKEEKRCNGKLWFVNFKNVVWHESTKKLFVMIAVHSKTGCWVKCWDNINRHFFPLILILSVDYKEQAIMALICGTMSNFPCPKCLIPQDQISTFPDLCELHTSENIVKTLEEARSQRLADNKKAILTAQGLCDIDNAFQIIDNTDVYQALSWDGLHTNSAGDFGDHLWTELQKVLEKEGQNAMATVEKNLHEMPHWHALNHFDEGLSVLYTDGQKHEDLSKIIVFACHDVLTHEENTIGYLLLCCLHAYIKYHLYTAFELHTIDLLYAEKTANISKKNWNFPKNHLGIHVFDDIKAKGNIAEQVSQMIEDYDNYTSTMRGDEAMDGVDNDADEYYFHVQLGSAQKPLTLQSIKEEVQGSFPDGRCIQFSASDTIVECQFLQVNFESMVDWCQYTDYLCCNPTFHGWPHYDCVIIKTYQGHIFRQLVSLFKCTVSREEFPLALIQLYDAPIGQQLSKDKHLNFWRVQEQPCTSTEFFSVQSIIHRALLYPDNSRPGDYLVMDTIDTDMFLHIQAMHQAAGHLS
ncbi:hypothetical protein V8B97DRAFT_2025824 [Scleroderma yunnanense]